VSTVEAPPTQAPKPKTPSTNSGRGRSLIPPLIVGVVAVVAWEVLVRVFNIQKFLIPRPSSIIAALSTSWADILEGTKRTGYVAVSGLIVGVIIAVALALLCTRFHFMADALTPMAAALAATPIVALAPIYFKWFGATDATAKQCVVVSVVIFPVFINTARGLLEVQNVQIELMHTYGVGDWAILREVRLPNALPFFFTSLKVASSLAVIAAIVAEYFGGQQGTLGSIITQSAGLSRYDRAWAAVLMAALLGIVLYAIVVVLERTFIPWERADARR